MKSVRPPPPTSPPCKSPARSFRSPTHYPVQPSEYSCPQSTIELYESSHSYVYNERTTEGILVKKTPFFCSFGAIMLSNVVFNISNNLLNVVYSPRCTRECHSDGSLVPVASLPDGYRPPTKPSQPSHPWHPSHPWYPSQLRHSSHPSSSSSPTYS